MSPRQQRYAVQAIVFALLAIAANESWVTSGFSVLASVSLVALSAPKHSNPANAGAGR